MVMECIKYDATCKPHVAPKQTNMVQEEIENSEQEESSSNDGKELTAGGLQSGSPNSSHSLPS